MYIMKKMAQMNVKLVPLLVVLYLFLYHVYWKYICKPDFHGKAVFITGASSGIGEALAKRFAKANVAKIFILARRMEEL